MRGARRIRFLRVNKAERDTLSRLQAQRLWGRKKGPKSKDRPEQELDIKPKNVSGLFQPKPLVSQMA